MQQAVVVVEPEQNRPDHFLLFGVAESADHAVGSSQVLHLHHADPFSGHVTDAQALCNYSIETASDFPKPLPHDLYVCGSGTQTHNRISTQIFSCECLECRPPFFDWLLDER